MNKIARALALAVLMAAAWLPGRAAVVVTFEGLADSALVGTVGGATFDSLQVLSAGQSLNEFEVPPHSGVNVGVNVDAAVEVSFAANVLSVTGYLTYLEPVLVEFFGSSGLVGSYTSLFSSNLALSGDAGSSPNELFSFSSASPITLVKLTGGSAGSFVLDDFGYTLADSPPPPPPPPPPGTVPEAGSLWLALLALLVLAAARFGPIGLIALVLPWLSAPVAAQGIAMPSPSPAALQVGATTSVLVTAQLGQVAVLPGGVNVLRVSPTGQTSVLGSLNDAGQNGDVLAGDGVYAGRVTMAESIEGQVGLRLSVAVKGSLKRLSSADAALAVVPAGAPVALPTPNLSLRTIDPVSGAQVLSNAITACFADATSYAGVLNLSALVGGVPTGRYSAIGNCYRLTIAPTSGAGLAAAITSLAAQPGVKFAEPEAIVRGAAACAGPVCADPNYSTVLRLPQALTLGQGAGVVIGILDSGLDAGLIAGTSFPTAILGSNFSTSGTAGIPKDDNGHGTLVAHIAQATAPGSTLFVAKVLDNHLDGSEGTTYNGIEEAIANGAKIINLSLSSKLQSFGMLTYLNHVQNNKKLIVVAAAGNDGSTVQEYPAAHLGVVAVGNVDDHDQRWTGTHPSNFGPWVNIAAPGVNVAGLDTGTSFSTPFVAGAAALVRAKFPALSREQVIAQLFKSALPIPFLPGQDQCPALPCNQGLGSGRLDVEAALGSIRITRNTAVGATGAAIVRTIDVQVRSAGGSVVLPTTQRSFFGQSAGCEVATVKNPPCISNVPFDFAALPNGNYVLKLNFLDPTASFFGTVQLNTPGAKFTGVSAGTASISGSDPARADFSLFGFGVHIVELAINKS